MLKIKALQDYGLWLKKGQILEVNNEMALFLIGREYAELIGYVKTTKKNCIAAAEMKHRLHLLKKYEVNLRVNYSLTTVIKILERVDKEKK